ncbi:hypothetical protein BKA57DRAFT_233269 [Linnemannia elongata]|nr:hypothetical protein BKA57DRAFT_233172 [Linnemannia elongata]KAH7054733.1 hypothetical protein BKA57DRAFT_233269 [Linnemannia elongata]
MSLLFTSLLGRTSSLCSLYKHLPRILFPTLTLFHSRPFPFPSFHPRHGETKIQYGRDAHATPPSSLFTTRHAFSSGSNICQSKNNIRMLCMWILSPWIVDSWIVSSWIRSIHHTSRIYTCDQSGQLSHRRQQKYKRGTLNFKFFICSLQMSPQTYKHVEETRERDCFRIC